MNEGAYIAILLLCLLALGAVLILMFMKWQEEIDDAVSKALLERPGVHQQAINHRRMMATIFQLEQQLRELKLKLAGKEFFIKTHNMTVDPVTGEMDVEEETVCRLVAQLPPSPPNVLQHPPRLPAASSSNGTHAYQTNV